MNPKYYRIYDNSVENPFENYTIDNNSFLDELVGRTLCSKCKRSRKYFCYTCYRPMPEFAHKVPKVKLPFKIDIIKHERELEGKATSVHAAIIAPDDVTVYMYPHNVPDYSKNNEKTILIYPSKNSMSIDEFIAQHTANATSTSSQCEEANVRTPPEETASCQEKESERKSCDVPVPFEKAVFIDATWPQSRSIMSKAAVKNLPCITLRKRMSFFWRHQKNSPRWYLATIEAIHQLLNEVDPNNNGRYDNLLFYFEFMYRKIHTLYSYDTLLAYKRKMDLSSEKEEEKANKSTGHVPPKPSSA
uniref:tRNA-uridine aminocarboxypropyltransferase 1 n=1 Tax=Cacopsylla melanoneura TaxID=428564 RepID=A0A8D8W2T0_9HEMI